jgi:hypothetical protein
LPGTSGAPALEPHFPVPLPPVPALLALSEPGGRQGRRNFATLFLEKIGWAPDPAPPFQGKGLADQTLAGLTESDSRKVKT